MCLSNAVALRLHPLTFSECLCRNLRSPVVPVIALKTFFNHCSRQEKLITTSHVVLEYAKQTVTLRSSQSVEQRVCLLHGVICI